jgi:DNA-binding XRE family transcriptional regulator
MAARHFITTVRVLFDNALPITLDPQVLLWYIPLRSYRTKIGFTANYPAKQLTNHRYWTILTYIGREAHMIVMPDTEMKQYRLRARLSIAQLARIAQVDETTVRRAETGQPVQEVKAFAIAQALSQELGQNLSMNDLGIVIYRQ